MCVIWFIETKSVIKRQRRYRTQYGKDPLSDNVARHWLKQCQGTGSVVAAIEPVTQKMLDNTWREIESAWTSYVPRKAFMLKLFSILRY
jgi:hypothetical protein